MTRAASPSSCMVAETTTATFPTATPPPPEAVAILHDQQGQPAGTVTFTQIGGHVRVSAYVTGLAPFAEFHGFHVHANGKCDGDFVTSAGGHWNPVGAPHGDHVGDLPV